MKSSRGPVHLLTASYLPILACTALTLLLGLGGAGCVSKSKAEAGARAAFLAGQQQGTQQVQLRGPAVTVIGEVKNKLLPWSIDLTLARAIVAADYYGARDPTEITIIREGHLMPVDPHQLLAGEDIPLLPQDIVELKSSP